VPLVRREKIDLEVACVGWLVLIVLILIGDLFAICPYDPNDTSSVEPVLDSSRYFVLRIENEGASIAAKSPATVENTDTNYTTG
jgi:Protein of unknown function (DUF1681)